MKLDNFRWTRQKNGVLDFIDIYNKESVFGKGYVNMCMMHENKHILATNLRACFGFLTLHKSTKLAERILTKEKLALNKEESKESHGPSGPNVDKQYAWPDDVEDDCYHMEEIH